MTRQTAVSVLAALMEVYDKPLSDQAQDLYIRALENDEPDLLKSAAARAITTIKWLPKVSELKELIKVIQDERAQEATYKFHSNKIDRILPSGWLRWEAWELRGREPIQPVKLDWHTCQRCGQQYANWNDCPECVK